MCLSTGKLSKPQMKFLHTSSVPHFAKISICTILTTPDLRLTTPALRLATSYAAVGVIRVPSTGPFMRFEIAVSSPRRTMPAISKYHPKFWRRS
jgi:hypothetical protein